MQDKLAYSAYRVVVSEDEKGFQEAFIAQVWFDSEDDPTEWSRVNLATGVSRGYPVIAVDNLQNSWEEMSEAFTEEVYIIVENDSGQYLEVF